MAEPRRALFRAKERRRRAKTARSAESLPSAAGPGRPRLAARGPAWSGTTVRVQKDHRGCPDGSGDGETGRRTRTDLDVADEDLAPGGRPCEVAEGLGHLLARLHVAVCERGVGVSGAARRALGGCLCDQDVRGLSRLVVGHGIDRWFGWKRWLK